MLRAYILAFGGKGGAFGGLWGGPYRGEHEERLQESPRTMTIPLILLAIPSVIAGYWFGFFTYLQPTAPSLNFFTIVSDWKTWLGVVLSLGRDVRHVETGRVQTYMVGFFGGVAVLAAVVFVLVTVVK